MSWLLLEDSNLFNKNQNLAYWPIILRSIKFGTSARYRAVVWTVRMSRSAFNLQRHFEWTAEVDSHNPMKFCRLQPMLLGHRRKNSRSAGVAPTSSDLESEAHRYEYQDRIENRSLSSGATNLICTFSLASDVLCNVFLNDIRDIRTLQFEMVVRVGLAPTLFLMWQIYSLRPSLLGDT